MIGTSHLLVRSGLVPSGLAFAAALAWALFGALWIAAAAWTSRAAKRISGWQSALDGLIYLSAFALLFAPAPWTGALWHLPQWLGLLLLGGECAALAFAWWARVHLGKLWSGAITLRAGHTVIRSGPYHFVRHPVYTGFIGAAWMFALLVGAPTALLGAGLLSAEMAWKARREEQFLRSELGPEEYDSYAATTPMLLPRFVGHA